MRIINLIMKKKSSISLEFDNVLPELLFDKTLSEIQNVIIYRGNREESLGEYFGVEISGNCEDASDCTIIIDGDLSRVKRIGFAMTCGKIIANSDVDFHVGACMSGGEIIVNGDAESYAGREMTGGTLEILGSVKEFCGSSYAGEWRGMSGGKIIVHENAGKHLADYMIGGSIHIMGNCDVLAGVHMSGGVIRIDGDVTQWLGGQMKKGTIILNGKINGVLPGFVLSEYVHHPLIGDKYYVGRYALYSGDKTVRGRGKLWIKQQVIQ